MEPHLPPMPTDILKKICTYLCYDGYVFTSRKISSCLNKNQDLVEYEKQIVKPLVIVFNCNSWDKTSRMIILPVNIEYNINITVDWGDGKQEDFCGLFDVESSFKHTYKSAGIFTIRVFPGKTQPGEQKKKSCLYGLGINRKTRPCSSWEWASKTNIKIISLGNIGIRDISYLYKKSLLKDFKFVETWDTSNIKYMDEVFSECTSFNADVSRWDVSKVIAMSHLFKHCHQFNINLNRWNVSSVQYMDYMFSDCYEYDQPMDLWDVSKVRTMSGMFFQCSVFNQNLNTWNISNVHSTEYMFYYCDRYNQEMSNWNTSSAWKMEQMFSGCTKFNQPLTSWDVSSVKSFRMMFYCCETLCQDFSSWQLKDNADTEDMFLRSNVQKHQYPFMHVIRKK